MAKMTLLDVVQEIPFKYDKLSGIPKSTQWARQNKSLVAERDKARGRTLKGKLTSLAINCKNRSKAKNIAYDLDSIFLMDLYNSQNGLCAITKKQMIIRTARHDVNFPYVISVDRIDSTLGYTRDNVQLTCAGVNLMKNTMTMTQFIDFCGAVWENNHG